MNAKIITIAGLDESFILRIHCSNMRMIEVLGKRGQHQPNRDGVSCVIVLTQGRRIKINRTSYVTNQTQCMTT